MWHRDLQSRFEGLRWQVARLTDAQKYRLIAGSLGVLAVVCMMSICVFTSLLSGVRPIPTVTPVIPTSAPLDPLCADPTAPDVPWQQQDPVCLLHEQEAVGVAMTFTVDMNYPTALAQYPFAKSAMLGYLNQRRGEFWNARAGLTAPESEVGPWVLQVIPQVFQHSATITSVLFTVTSYTGGAHPALDYGTLTFDLATQQILTLADVFQAGVDPYAVIAPIAREDLTTRFPDLTDFINPGTEPIADNFNNWVLTSDSLVLYFPPYQVGPYAAGPQTVTIPLVDLADSLNPLFVPGP